MAQKKIYKSSPKKTATKSSSNKLIRTISIIIAIGIILFYIISPNKAQKLFGIGNGQGIVTEGFVISDFDDAYPVFSTYTDDNIYHHTYYGLSYSDDFKAPYWVSYILTKKMVTVHKVDRDDEEFTRDPLLDDNYAVTSDYTNSGYDRGHMCPAGDMNFNQTAMTETFYMTNITPQKPGLNRQIWKELEEKVRDWAVENDSLYIVVGAIYSDNPKRIGDNEVAVPDKLYKVVADISSANGYKAIAFVFENKDYNSDEEFMDYAISVDELEQLTGVDFFANYQSSGVEEIEATLDLSLWR